MISVATDAVASIITGAARTEITTALREENDAYLVAIAKVIASGQTANRSLEFALEALARDAFSASPTAFDTWQNAASFYRVNRYSVTYVADNLVRLVGVAGRFLRGEDVKDEFRNRVMIAIFN